MSVIASPNEISINVDIDGNTFIYYPDTENPSLSFELKITPIIQMAMIANKTEEKKDIVVIPEEKLLEIVKETIKNKDHNEVTKNILKTILNYYLIEAIEDYISIKGKNEKLLIKITIFIQNLLKTFIESDIFKEDLYLIVYSINAFFNQISLIQDYNYRYYFKENGEVFKDTPDKLTKKIKLDVSDNYIYALFMLYFATFVEMVAISDEYTLSNLDEPKEHTEELLIKLDMTFKTITKNKIPSPLILYVMQKAMDYLKF